MTQPIDNAVEQWLETWPPDCRLSDHEYTLIVGNLRGFYLWLKESGRLAEPNTHENKTQT